MKQLFLVSILLNTFLYSSVTTNDITKMIKEIKEERVGISMSKLETTANPFIINKKKEPKVEKEKKRAVIAKRIVIEPTYKLDAILNHAAFINKKWYKVGDKLGSYTVTSLGKSSITISSKSGKKTLNIKKKKKSFLQLNKGNK